jgi:membrane-bound ClpP family serine protease
MSPLAIIIGILVFGTLLFIVEVFIMPTLIIGKIAFVVTLVGLALAFYELGALYGSLCVLAAILINGLLLYFGMNRISKSKISVQEVIDSKVNIFEDFGLKVEDEGITITDLRPEGKAMFNEQKVTVWALTGFIATETKIRINQINNNKIFVKPI